MSTKVAVHLIPTLSTAPCWRHNCEQSNGDNGPKFLDWEHGFLRITQQMKFCVFTMKKKKEIFFSTSKEFSHLEIKDSYVAN